MEPTDPTLEVLRSIRDEVHGLGSRVDETNARLDQTITRLDQTITRLDETNTRIDRLERRQTEADMRVATQLVALVGAVNEVRDALREELAVRVRRQVDDHERRIRALESKPG